ncbi:GNAT family N-acetyltransferase [Streptomyces beijiangensis]|uniref:GNAT family N-acetyltransferase n=1 Tax=Streptomyces beijiangensis TaxID=163361 RepID=A0A939FAP7_9ACTN|nr:GNAT family N-acetyltransferase [Streptomyces beijiangensis]MBO0513987.1 GNAT family N-acetyltransferase [Streptomyces beijiangensis]
METPAEILTFDQVELRRWRASDLGTLDRVVVESLAHLRPWMPWAASYDSDTTAGYLDRAEKDWESGEAYNYAITTAGSVIGSCSLMRRIGPGGLEIGYWLHPGWTGRGLVTMAARALLRQGFELAETDRIEIHHDEANQASGAVPRRLGFTEVERLLVPEGPATSGDSGIDVIWRLLWNEAEAVTAPNRER